MHERQKSHAAEHGEQGGAAEAVVDALDVLIDRGVVLHGDVELGVAEVALVRAGIRLYLRGVRSAPETDPGQPSDRREVAAVAPPSRSQPRRAFTPTPPDVPSKSASTSAGAASADPHAGEPTAPLVGGAEPGRGLAHLVILLIDILRRLLERQAMRRVEDGNLPADRVEELGLTFAALEEQVEELTKRLDEMVGRPESTDPARPRWRWHDDDQPQPHGRERGC